MSKSAVQILVSIFLASLLYAVTRYHVFAGVPPADFALYVFNKVLALAGFTLLIFGSGAYYSQFYRDSGALTAIGSWSMLLGVLAFAWLWIYNISLKLPGEDEKPLRALVSAPTTLMVAGFLAAGHVAVMGFKGWLQPGEWAGGLPPISLVAFVSYLLGFILRRLAGR